MTLLVGNSEMILEKKQKTLTCYNLIPCIQKIPHRIFQKLENLLLNV